MTLLHSIQAWTVRVPLLSEWASSEVYGPHVEDTTRLILHVTDGEGFSGWGEGPTSLRGESLRDCLALLPQTPLEQWCPALLDLHASPSYWQEPVRSPFRPNPARLRHRLRHPLQCAVETALLDLTARRAGVPLSHLFGGAWRDRVTVDYWMGRESPARATLCARRAVELGFRGIKCKTTLEDENVERLEAIRSEAGPDFRVTVDPNGRFYRLADAIATIRALDAVGNMHVLEDPFPRHNPGGSCAGLQGTIKARLVAHLDPPEALCAVLRQGQVDGLNIDSHTQGLCGWHRQAAAADVFNLPVWHGSSLDLGIATAAQLHLAAAAPNCELPGDQCGPWLREAHLLKTPLIVENGTVRVPSGPGLGVDADPDQIDRFATEHVQL